MNPFFPVNNQVSPSSNPRIAPTCSITPRQLLVLPIGLPKVTNQHRFAPLSPSHPSPSLSSPGKFFVRPLNSMISVSPFSSPLVLDSFPETSSPPSARAAKPNPSIKSPTGFVCPIRSLRQTLGSHRQATQQKERDQTRPKTRAVCRVIRPRLTCMPT
ncbi:hypothetical protein CKAH01_06548 [Colletotrichum kahawae]|uniref:Uncharacterized protein n=1 Tax=Colletotrichum kahawae TaxID=34407 RepID=A0AAD9YBA8_COLKA|nr:hypothetical protein CKAH01_06548 [Colletotrichum kahawae]